MSTWALVICSFACVLLLTAASATIDLGLVSNYGVMVGPNAHGVQFSNSTYNGNVGIDKSGTTAGGNYIQFSSGTINGNADFAGTVFGMIGLAMRRLGRTGVRFV